MNEIESKALVTLARAAVEAGMSDFPLSGVEGDTLPALQKLGYLRVRRDRVTLTRRGFFRAAAIERGDDRRALPAKQKTLPAIKKREI